MRFSFLGCLACLARQSVAHGALQAFKRRQPHVLLNQLGTFHTDQNFGLLVNVVAFFFFSLSLSIRMRRERRGSKRKEEREKEFVWPETKAEYTWTFRPACSAASYGFGFIIRAEIYIRQRLNLWLLSLSEFCFEHCLSFHPRVLITPNPLPRPHPHPETRRGEPRGVNAARDSWSLRPSA